MNNKLIIGIVFLIAVVLVVVIAVLLGQQPSSTQPPSSNLLFDFNFPIEPDTFYYEEFSVKKDGILQIELSCSHEDANLLWYIMDCDDSTFVNREEDEFYDLTYKRNIKGENPISDTVTIEEGTYTFVYVQTVGYIGEQNTRAKIVFSEHSSTSSPTPTPTPIATPTPTPTPTTSPTPTPTPQPTSMILSHTSYTSIGYFHVVGEVQNTLSTNIEYVEIIATFYDSSDTVIGTAFTFTYMDILKPNQKSPFDLSSYPDEITPASYKLTVDYLTTSEQPLSGLAILSHTPSVDSLGYHKIVGEVKNNADKEADFVQIVGTYYDSAGKVIGASYTFTNPEDLGVGDTAPFELSSYPRKINPTSYELQVQGI